MSRQIHIVAVLQLPFTNVFDAVYKEVQRQRTKFRFDFVVIPSVQPGTSQFRSDTKEIVDLLNSKGYPYILGYDQEYDGYLDLQSLNPDLVLLQTPYDDQRVSEKYQSSYISCFTRVGAISYGLNWVEDERVHGDNAFYKNCWRVFVENDLAAEYINTFASGKAVPIGYIKCEPYLRRTRTQRVKNLLQKSRLGQRKTTIFWKPRWTADTMTSNFLKYVHFFIKLAQKDKSIRIVMYKHPLLKSQIIDKSILSENEYEKIENATGKLNNFEFEEGGNFLDTLWDADLMVSDYSSTIAEFLLTGKPVIYTPTQIKLNLLGQKIVESMYIANNQEDLSSFIDTLRSGVDPLWHKRQAIGDTISTHRAHGKTMAQYFLDYIQKEIE